jgi:hypothetical protein
MSQHLRSLAIGLLGPALSATGLLWIVTREIIYPEWATSLHNMVFDPGFLLVFVGLVTSAICVPIALEVAAAAPEELELQSHAGQPALEENSSEALRSIR